MMRGKDFVVKLLIRGYPNMPCRCRHKDKVIIQLMFLWPIQRVDVKNNSSNLVEDFTVCEDSDQAMGLKDIGLFIKECKHGNFKESLWIKQGSWLVFIWLIWTVFNLL